MSAKRRQEEQTHQVEVIRLGCDEMNLVEYPFASLWNKEEPGAKIEREWDAVHPLTGRKVKATWRVTGDPDLGLPGPSDERLYLALMELSCQKGLDQQVVAFTRYDLLKRLNWPDNRNGYRMLLDGFRRLKAVSITSENAFWDASIKSFRSVGFGVIDNYDIVAERPGRKAKDEGQRDLPLSFFRWNDVLFGSVQSGYIRTLNVGFALSLKGDAALRLFRYLDKKAYDGRRGFEIELAALCDRHLGMKPTRHDSTRRARLKRAHDELVERGFLGGVEFAPMKTRKAEKVCYSFAPRRKEATGQSQAPLIPSPEPLKEPLIALPEPNSELELSGLQPTVGDLAGRMTSIGVSVEVARAFEVSVPPEELLLQLDCLGDRKAKDEAAVFVKSVREKWAIPQAHLDRIEARERSQRAREAQEAQKHQKAEQKAAKSQEEAQRELETAHLDALWEQLDEPARERIDAQAQFRLGVLGQAGRAPAALMAMRRSLLREGLTQEASSDVARPDKAT